MKLMQFYKILLLIIGCCYIYATPVKPNNSSKEENIVLITKTKSDGNKKRHYYLIDDDGLKYSYTNFKSLGYKVGDKVNLQIMSRTYMASNSNERKKYEFELVILKRKKEIFKRDLTYSKKSSDVVSQKTKKGFYFTQAGYWFEDIILDKETEIIIKPKVKKGHKVYIRLIAEKKSKKTVSKDRVYPVDYQKKISISYEDGIKRNDWYLIDSKLKQQFMLDENKIYKVITRKVKSDSTDQLNYSIDVSENGQFLGEYIFEGNLSNKNAYISSDYLDLKNRKLSKENSFYVSVPNDSNINREYAYYTFSSDKNILLIKLIEYEK